MKRPRKKRTFDIEISGEGFYSIHALSARGIHWMRQVQGFDGHVAYSDQTGMTQDIADAAHSRRLAVIVNGREYLGNNRAGRKVTA